MKVTKQEIRRIFEKLDKELHELQFQQNTSTLIQISADFKDIKEVIQYFENSIDSLKTQNEAFKEILKESVREMCIIKEKMLDGIISRDELMKELNELSHKVLTEQHTETAIHIKVKKYLNNAISPKMLIVAIAIILLISSLTYNPEVTKEVLHEISPIIKKVK